MNNNIHLCQYDDPKGVKCTEEAGPSGFCYWHDKSIDKSGPEVKENLVEFTRSGGMTRGICLKGADLSQIDLVNHHYKEGFDFFLRRLLSRRSVRRTFVQYHLI